MRTANPTPQQATSSSTSTHVGLGSQEGWTAPATALPAADAITQYLACEHDAQKLHAVAKNLPRATGHDIQCLADPLFVVGIDKAASVAEYRTVPDPTPDTGILTSAILGDFQAGLDAFDRAAYAKNGSSTPDFVVAVATPAATTAGANFVGTVMAAFPSTDLFTPPTIGANGRRLQLVIACGQATAQRRTLCAWQGTGFTAAGPQPYFGALLFPAAIPSGRAESLSESVIAGLAPAT